MNAAEEAELAGLRACLTRVTALCDEIRNYSGNGAMGWLAFAQALGEALVVADTPQAKAHQDEKADS